MLPSDPTPRAASPCALPHMEEIANLAAAVDAAQVALDALDAADPFRVLLMPLLQTAMTAVQLRSLATQLKKLAQCLTLQLGGRSANTMKATMPQTAQL